MQTAGSGPRPKADTPAQIHDAAQQFEALLLTQILRSARESDGGWLGLGADSASDCASDLADEQLALAMSQRGGLGLADLIAAGLTKDEPESGR
ncbi:MAG: rod-binding protein [Bryobacteraceae bacterium]